MRIPKIYLESTVFNFFFAYDAPDKRKDTLKLFKEIKEGKYAPYTSNAVLGADQQQPVLYALSFRRHASLPNLAWHKAMLRFVALPGTENPAA